MKTCTKCNANKPIEQFHNRKSEPDGKTPRCKKCRREDKLLYYYTNRTKILAIHAKKKQTPKGRERIRAYRNLYKERNPEKSAARKAVKINIQKGIMPPACTLQCTKCESKAEHYHHHDYSKKLDVIPLCRQCHMDEHLGPLEKRIMENTKNNSE